MSVLNLKIKQIFVIFIYFFLVPAEVMPLFAQDVTWDELPNIIVITLSGVRNSESIEDPTHQYIPNLWNKMIKEGTLYTNLIDLNVSFHMPAVQAINTGKIYPALWGIDVPSIFQYVREKYNMPISKIWSIGHWDDENCYYLKGNKYIYPCALTQRKFEISSIGKKILSRQELIFFESFKESDQMWPTWDSIGPAYDQISKKIFKEFKPKLIHYIMADVEAAHFGTFGRYVLSLRSIDRRIFEIWQMVKEDPYYKDNTYLIVNIDHTRDAYYMEHDHTKEKVWMYIYGPDIKKGIVIERVVHHIDIFATVARIFDLKTHSTEGKVLKDCFHDR